MDIVLGPLVWREVAGGYGGIQSTVAVGLRVGGQVGVVPAEVKRGLDLCHKGARCPRALSSTEQKRMRK